VTTAGDEGLRDAIAQVVASLPAGYMESLVAAVAPAGRYDPALTARAGGTVANPAYRYQVRALFDAWRAVPDVSGSAIALGLQAACRARGAAQGEQSIEVAWTGPTTHAVPVRRTREVLLELIGLARSRLTVVSFAAYRVPEVLAELGAATERGVDVRLVLEGADESQGRLTHDAAAAFRSLGTAVSFYVWPRAARGEAAAGVLHAKAVIADARTALVTSANQTGYALSANMELGLLVSGGTVAARLQAHFDELIAGGTLRRVTVDSGNSTWPTLIA
jgi:phosphatidylserine/phosphatidylglycerophosphate/cardiolipin synthase-like enzyme